MFDKWVNQDISNVLARRNRVVVGAEAAHPFDSVDLQWLSELIAHLPDSDSIKDKLPHIRARFKSSHGRQWRKGLWSTATAGV